MSKTKTGIYAGVWDLLHPGHLYALGYASERCDHLTVAVNAHPTLDNPKKAVPIEIEADRVTRLRACRFVDEVITYRTGEAGLLKIYETGFYSVAFISEEHKETYTDPGPAEIIFVPKLSEHSSTRLRQRMGK